MGHSAYTGATQTSEAMLIRKGHWNSLSIRGSLQTPSREAISDATCEAASIQTAANATGLTFCFDCFFVTASSAQDLVYQTEWAFALRDTGQPQTDQRITTSK